MTTLYTNDFSSGLGSGWTQGGSWGTPSGWANASGDSSGGTYLKRAISAATYAETLAYGGASSGDNWGVIKVRSTGPGAIYDADGFGVLFRSWSFNGHQLEIFRVGGTAVPSSGNVTTLAYPHDVASALKLGIYSPSNTEVYIYANDVLVDQATGCTAQTGTNVVLGAYNSNNSFFDYLNVTDGAPPILTKSHWGRRI